MRRLVLSALGAAHVRSQPFYRAAHAAVLKGRGYGASGWVESGEVALLGRLKLERPDVRAIFDVGANVGGWALAATAAWPDAVVHAFEPSAATYEQLVAATAATPNITCVNAAASDNAGAATLYAVPGESGLSSLHRRDLAEHGLAMSGAETVQLTTIDDYCDAHGIAHIDLLKIDAEGHDLAVLRGAERMISEGRIDLIQFEFGGANIDSRTFLRDFVRLLEPAYRISRVLTDGVEPLTYSEREEVFVTTNFLAEIQPTDTSRSVT